MASLLRIVTAGVIAVLLACTIAAGDPNTSVQYKICNGDTSTTWSYNDLIDATLQDAVDQTSKSGFNYYNQKHAILTDTCYGHGKCNGVLSDADCETCLVAAQNLLRQQCAQSVGAQVQLVDCKMRYEKYAFNEG